MLARLDSFLIAVRRNWEVIALFTSLVATLVLYLLSSLLSVFTLGNDWYLPLVYVAVLAVVFMLIDIKAQTATSNTSDTYYANLQEAQPEIMKKLELAALKRKSELIEFKVWANRLSHVSLILTDAIRLSTSGKLGDNRLSISVYHTDPSLLPDAYVPGPRDVQVDDKHRAYLSSLSSNIDWVTRTAASASRVDVQFIKCAQVPYFYAYLIDGSYMFWGYFRWDDELKDWVGPSNPCNYVERGRDVMLLLDWMKNRFDILDGLYRK
jgi:hypothetical protein